MSENLERKCVPCDECQGVGSLGCIDLTGKEPEGFEVPYEVCYGHRCFSIKKVTIKEREYNISSEPYHGECDGHCGHRNLDLEQKK